MSRRTITAALAEEIDRRLAKSLTPAVISERLHLSRTLCVQDAGRIVANEIQNIFHGIPQIALPVARIFDLLIRDGSDTSFVVHVSEKSTNAMSLQERLQYGLR